MKLTRDDYAALERSYITREIADSSAGLYRLPSIEARELMGRKGGGDYAGIVFPYRLPGNAGPILYRLRLDSPPVDAASGKPLHKYLTAPGARNHLYFPPCDPGLLADAALPVVVTEGEKKCLSLWRAAIQSNGAGRPAFLPVAVPGVSSWRGQIGIATTASGERVPEKGVIPDFDRIVSKDRKITILFDANVASNPYVQAARRGLARELRGRGAEVWLADLPPAVGVNGIDDFLGMFGLEKALEVLKMATLYEWRDELIKSDAGRTGACWRTRSPRSAALPNGTESWHTTSTRSASRPCGTRRGVLFRPGKTATRSSWWTGSSITDCALRSPTRTRPSRPWRGTRAITPFATTWTARMGQDRPHRHWLTLYLGSPPSDYAHAVGARWLISAVARIYEPDAGRPCADPGGAAGHRQVERAPHPRRAVLFRRHR